VGILTGFTLRSLPGTVLDSNFSLGVVQVMDGHSRMMNKEFSTVIDSWLYTMYVYLYNIYQCSLHYSTRRSL
jgi:hypothetical protein